MPRHLRCSRIPDAVGLRRDSQGRRQENWKHNTHPKLRFIVPLADVACECVGKHLARSTGNSATIYLWRAQDIGDQGVNALSIETVLAEEATAIHGDVDPILT